jgi:hypothetical protein
MNDHDDLFDPTRFFRKTDPETSAKAAEQDEWPSPNTVSPSTRKN